MAVQGFNTDPLFGFLWLPWHVQISWTFKASMSVPGFHTDPHILLVSPCTLVPLLLYSLVPLGSSVPLGSPVPQVPWLLVMSAFPDTTPVWLHQLAQLHCDDG